VNYLDVIEGRDEITADYGPGTVETVTQHDGSVLRLRKLDASYDPTDRLAAMTYLQERQEAGEIVTGLLYLSPEPENLHGRLDTVPRPLNTLAEAELCPGSAALERLNAGLR
jgi:2-oxoglutarate ferredoxin oxidoreductase subunit beta